MGKKNVEKVRVVAIGASAGGLEALQEFFKNMHAQSGTAFVIIQHLSPDYKSLMDELLARQTSMKIEIIEDGVKIFQNRVYLIPPRKNLRIFENKLFLDDQDPKKGLNLPIDIFFRSLADDRGKDSIGIILSGTGSDGTMGTRAIKEVNGMIMAQDEESAKFSGMPNSSISTGLVDYVLPPSQMPEALLEYLKHPFVKKAKPLDGYEDRNLDNLSKAIMILRDHTGIDFSYYKENTILRRLERRVSINRYHSIEEYVKFLNESDKEKDVLSREVLIGVTQFFRDTESFEILNKKVIPEILAGNKIVRIWSAGCSTGEEVYSLAILFNEMAHRLNLDAEIKIFATDIDRVAIETAGQGIYPESIIADIDPKYLHKYFSKVEKGYKVNEEIRNMIVFATHNITKDPPFSKLDLLVCRNVFIYLKPEMQSRILSMFYYSLNTEGYLYLGSSETLGELNDAFEVIDSKAKIFKYKKGFEPKIIRELPALNFTKKSNSSKAVVRNGMRNDVKIDSMIESVISQFVPPSIIVDTNYKIISIINNVNSFTELQSGRYDSELFSILPRDLGLYLNNMLRQLKKGKELKITKKISSLPSFPNKNLRVTIIKFEVANKLSYIISFEFIEESLETDNESASKKEIIVGDFDNDRMFELERELQAVKENLNATVEELETSNEELQSSNEELIASNEELQSTNEELQSVNEELYTVNSEYQSKIEELTRLNNDINNLIKNTEIGALYLDSRLNLRKMTPEIYKISNLRERDLGRPINHLTPMNFYPELIDDITKVIDDLVPIDKEKSDFEGRTFFIKIRPYRTEHNAVDGVLVTVVNITELKQVKQEYSITHKRLNESLDLGKMSWWELLLKDPFFYFDEKMASLLGYRISELPRRFDEYVALIHPEDKSSFKESIKKMASGKVRTQKISYRIKTKDNGYIWIYQEGEVVEKSSSGAPLKATGTLMDISGMIKLKDDLQKNKQLVDLILENSPVATVMVDANGVITYANKLVESVLNLKKEKLLTLDFNSYLWQLTGKETGLVAVEKLPFYIVKNEKKAVYKYELKIDSAENKNSILSISGSPVFADNSRFTGAVFTIEKTR